jgi:hypothetical protein
MVSITSAARANLLQLIGANSEQDKVGSQLVSGKRVQTVSDNAFSFFQSRGLDNRVSTLTQINDKLAINVQAVNQASKAGNKISTALSTVKGLLEDIKSKGAAGNVESANAYGAVGANASIFNRTGTNGAPIDTGTQLADATELGTVAGGSGFTKVGLTAASDLAGFTNNSANVNATAGALSTLTMAGTDLLNTSGFANADVIKISNGGQNLFVRVVNTFTGTGTTQNGTGTSNGTSSSTGGALEVRTIDDLRNAISGLKADGATALDLDAATTGNQNLGLTASIDTSGAAGARFKIGTTNGSASTATFELGRQTGTGTALTAPFGQTLFGGTQITATPSTGSGATLVSYSNSTLSIGAAAAPVTGGTAVNAGLTVNDVVAVRIGTGTTARSIFAKVVTNFTAPPITTGGANQQAGDGLTEVTAIEVKSMADLANAFSGKKANGVDLINTIGVGQNNFSVNVDADSTGSKLKVSSSFQSTFTVKGNGGLGTYNTASAVALFGGTATAAAVDFAQPVAGGTANNLLGTNVAATTVNTGGLLVNDLIAFDVGPESNRTTLTVKVVANYTGANGTQRGNGKGNAYTGTDGPLEVKSIGDLVNALNARDKNNNALSDFSWNNNPSVRATFDASNTTGAAPAVGRFSFTAGTRIAIGVTRFGAVAGSAGLIFGTGQSPVAGSPPVSGASATLSAPALDGTLTSTQVLGTSTNNQAKEQRLSAAKAYRDTLDSIDRLTTDAQINGLNLLRNAAGFDAVLSETATQNVRLRSTVTNAASLGFTVINNIYQDGAEAEFATNVDVDKGLAKVDAAIASLGGRDTELDVQNSLLTERVSFNSDIIGGLGDLSTDLTAVNQEEASAQAAAASFSSNAALKFLGVSGQRASQLLQIF